MYPNSRIRRIVDLVVTLGLIYTLLAVPFRFGFNVPAEGVSLAVEVAVDLVFVIGIQPVCVRVVCVCVCVCVFVCV